MMMQKTDSSSLLLQSFRDDRRPQKDREQAVDIQHIF